eukprot:6025360-Alexandrium_andersonii.AAC.1
MPRSSVARAARSLMTAPAGQCSANREPRPAPEDCGFWAFASRLEGTVFQAALVAACGGAFSLPEDGCCAGPAVAAGAPAPETAREGDSVACGPSARRGAGGRLLRRERA